MPQRPFTPSGVQQKTADLYALPDPALQAEADAVRADLRLWTKSNFILNTGQETWLDAIDERFIKHLACEVGFAFENRLNVELSTTVPLPPPTISKMIDSTTTIRTRFSQDLGFSATGTLTISLAP